MSTKTDDGAAAKLPENIWWRREMNGPHRYAPANERPWQLWMVTPRGTTILLATDISRKAARQKAEERWAAICADALLAERKKGAAQP